MKNIILQHWSGPINKLGELSSTNISQYADRLGADYKLIRGNLFRPNLKTPWPPLQKLYMLDEVFDEYSMVIMLDMDMFIRKGMDENIFTDVSGVGRHTHVQERLAIDTRKQTKITNPKYSYWGGSIYRLDRKLRQTLRAHIKEEDIPLFCCRKMHGDEGYMHRLATLAKIKGHYLPNDRWGRSSFEKNVGDAAIIHIRTKITPKGPKKTKIENYQALVKRGLIDE